VTAFVTPPRQSRVSPETMKHFGPRASGALRDCRPGPPPESRYRASPITPAARIHPGPSEGYTGSSARRADGRKLTGKGLYFRLLQRTGRAYGLGFASRQACVGVASPRLTSDRRQRIVIVFIRLVDYE